MNERRRGLTGWCAATILVSAFLLFLVQPMISKMILPWFGGSPAVWTTCMLFFQVFLLAGYSYAHLLDRLVRTRAQGLIHLALLVAAVFALPIVPGPAWKPVDSNQPQFRILVLLAANVGLPYFLLASSAPLIQAWYSRSFHKRSPYRFYALSNLGSLAALLSYPFLIEPACDIPAQGGLWASGFRAFAVLSGGLALAMIRWNLPRASVTSPAASGNESPAPGIRQYLLWLLLPAFGSLSLLAVTNQICQDVAVVPFLWVVPLSLYLLTFILAFDSERWYLRKTSAVATVAVAVVISTVLLNESLQSYVDASGFDYEIPDFLDSLELETSVYLALMFFVCMLCHGELARNKPAPRYLTSFYLMISLGGAIGGLFVAMVCPVIFTSYAESDICLIGGFLLAVWVLLSTWWKYERRWRFWWRAVFAMPFACVASLFPRRTPAQTLAVGHRFYRVSNVVLRRRTWYTWVIPVSIVPVVAVAVIPLAVPFREDRSQVIVARRSFYGTLSVSEYGEPGEALWRRNLYNGRILHGVQFRGMNDRRIATTYYNDESGIGLTLQNLASVEPLRVATVGLGTGTIAAYGQAGDYYCFYEINPQVVDISQHYFTYLSDCPAEVKIVLGDARLSMEHQKPQHYNVIALDAFTGDAIPAHLLTVEAFAVYRRHLRRDGVIAVHVSNRHLDLRPIVALIAKHYAMEVVAVESVDHEGVADSSSDWLLVTNNEEFLNDYNIQDASEPVELPGPEIRVWTDHYSNLFQILQ